MVQYQSGGNSWQMFGNDGQEHFDGGGRQGFSDDGGMVVQRCFAILQALELSLISHFHPFM